ncbi:MAG: autotransporter-associated beta strand repeat-containing protein [Verrucomicrobiota bacterium]
MKHYPTHPIIRPTFSCALAVSLSAALLLSTAHAADGTWNVNTNGLWSAPANWLDDTAADGTGSTARFDALDITADRTVNLDSARTIGNLVFGDTSTATAAGWTIANNGTPANILTFDVAAGTPTITVNTLGTAKTAAITAVIAGTDGLDKNGAGTLVLSAANTFSGGFSVDAGTVVAMQSQALGAGSVTVASGAMLQLGDGTSNTFSVGNNLTLGGTLAASDRGVFTWTGDIALSGSAAMTVANRAGNLLTVSGDLDLGAHNLSLTPGGSSGGDITISGNITGSGDITNTGRGVLTLSGNNTGYSGVTTINRATLAIGHDQALGTGALNLSINDQLVTVRSTDATTRTLANQLILGGNGGTTFAFGATSGGTGNLTFTNTGAIDLGASSRKFQVHNRTQFNGEFFGAVGIIKSGAGTLVLAGENDYSGATVVEAGTLLVDGSLAAESTVTVNSGARIGGLGSVGDVTINTGAALAYNLANVAQAGDGLTAASLSGAGLGDLTIHLTGLGAGFDSDTNYSWSVLTSDSVASISLAAITLDTSEFGQAFTGEFNLVRIEDSLVINYVGTAIPEPSSFALIAGGILLAFSTLRRRRIA